jgi:hypothetical protein
MRRMLAEKTWEEAAGNVCIVFLIAFRTRQRRVGVNATPHLQPPARL